MAENVQYADSLVGKDLVFLMKQNRDLLMKRYNHDGVTVVDNLELICGYDYIDQNWTTEHYNQRGRMKIAQHLARALKPFYNEEFKEVPVRVEGCMESQPPEDTASVRRSLEDIERRIRATPEWFEQVKAKAKQKNIPLDEMIRKDARYVYDTDPKSHIK
jgi:hypothetical protein